MILTLLFIFVTSDWYIDKYGVGFEDKECKVLTKATKSDLVEYEIPFSVEKIVDSSSPGEGPFYGTRESLKTITFGKGSNIEQLGIYCFSSLYIQSVDFSTCFKLKILPYGCFKDCSKIVDIKFPPNLEIINTGALMNLGSISEMNFPPSLQKTGNYHVEYIYSISKCPKLTSISFGIDSNLTELGTVTFSDCGLASIILPRKLRSIGMSCFSGTPLTSISIEPGNNYFATDGIALYDITQTKLILVPYVVSDTIYNVREGVKSLESGCMGKILAKTVTISSTVKSIGSECFISSLIEEILIPSTVTSISVSVFVGCQKLKSATIEATINILNSRLFDGCTALESFRIPSGVKTIKEKVFASCSSLSYVFVPKSVTTIESAVFYNVKAGIIVEFEEGSPIKMVNDTIITSDDTKIIAYIGSASLLDLKIAANIEIIGYSAYQNKNVRTLEFEEGSSLTSIETYAFDGCLIERVSFPPLLAHIETYSFRGCKSLSLIEFNENIEDIGIGSFSACTKIASIAFPRNLKDINNSAFAGCSSLSRITIDLDSKLETIGDGAFSETSVTEFSIPSGVRTIGSRSFSDSKLYSIVFTVGKSANWTITKGAFMNCKNLKQVVFGDVAGIGESAFEGCTQLESLKIGWNVREIQIYAFKGCTNLKTIELSESKTLESIAGFAFTGCPLLSQFDIGSDSTRFGTMYNDSVLFTTVDEGDCFSKLLLFLPNSQAKSIELKLSTKYISAYAFESALNLESVIIPDGSVIEIGFNAFLNCKRLSYVSFGDSVEKFGNRLFEGCSSLGCGSIKFTSEQYLPLIDAGVDAEAMTPCPTRVFSAGFEEGLNVLFSGIIFSSTSDES